MTALTKKNQGDLWLGISAIAFILGLAFLGMTLFRDMPRYSALKSDGLLVEGYVTYKQTETRRTRRGSSSSNHYLTVEFNTKNGKPFAEAQPKVKSKNPIDNIKFGYIGKVPGGDASAKLNVNRTMYDSVSRGSAVEVVFLAASPADAVLAERVRDYTPWSTLSFSAVMLVIGIGMVAMGLKKRREAQA